MIKLLVSVLTGAVVAGGLGAPAFAAGPGVASVTPKNGATGVAITVHPTVTFTSAVDPNSLRYSFVKTSGSVSVASFYNYDAASRTISITPRAALAGGTKYTITATIKNAGGTRTHPSRRAFTTALGD